MSDKRVEDEAAVIDFLLGRMGEQEARDFEMRMASDARLRRLRHDVSLALKALALLPEVEDREGLVERTLARIRQDQQTKAILARQEMARRSVMPTFTLRELAAMAAVAVILAVVFIPSVRAARQQMLAGECAGQMGQIGSSMLTYANANNGSLPIADVQPRFWLSSQRQAAASNAAALFRLVQSGYIAPPNFQCPAVGGGSFVVKAGMVDFPAGKYVSYSYQHALGSGGLCLNDPALGARQESKVVLGDATPVFAQGRFHPDRANDTAISENHSGGQNVLYMTGRVAWVTTPTVGVNGDNIFLVSGVSNYQGNEMPSSPAETFLLPAYPGN
ncbi:MAG: hypothetical protein ACE15C_14025 [Phycisphaerae bacterium]